MQVKDSVVKLMENQTHGQGCKLGDKFCLIESLFNNLPEKALQEYKDVLIDKNFETIMADQDMVTCINELFNHNLNVAETSRNSYVHRNTLLYRIDKIQKMTGLNVRDFNDAVTFKILMMVYKSFIKGNSFKKHN